MKNFLTLLLLLLPLTTMLAQNPDNPETPESRKNRNNPDVPHRITDFFVQSKCTKFATYEYLVSPKTREIIPVPQLNEDNIPFIAISWIDDINFVLTTQDTCHHELYYNIFQKDMYFNYTIPEDCEYIVFVRKAWTDELYIDVVECATNRVYMLIPLEIKVSHISFN